MKKLQKSEFQYISAGELVCTESSVSYFENDSERYMRIFMNVKGSQEDFEKLTESLISSKK